MTVFPREDEQQDRTGDDDDDDDGDGDGSGGGGGGSGSGSGGEKINVNDILEWFPRSVSSDSIVESTYCVDLVRRLPSPLSIKVKGRFCPGKCLAL